MKVAIDCRSLRKQPAGVPNFLLSVINTLAAQQKDWKLTLLSNADFHPEVNARLVQSPNVRILISPLPFLGSIAIIWYLFKVPSLVSQLQADIFYSPIPNLPFWISKRTRKLVTVHDMVYKLFPSTMSLTNWWINFMLHDRSIQNADFVWAISNYTHQLVEKHFPNRKSRTVFTGASIDKKAFTADKISIEQKQKVLQKYGLSEKFILFVGTLEPRKNLPFLTSLMEHPVLREYSLLVVGATGWGKKLRGAKAAENRVHFAGFVSTQALVELYKSADVYVSASLNEGFGLPQLEAMACGCPVVSPHNSAMIEVVSGAGETVEGWDKDLWASTIARVIENRDFYVERGFKRAESYDWDQIGQGLARFINTSELNSDLRKERQ